MHTIRGFTSDNYYSLEMKRTRRNQKGKKATKKGSKEPVIEGKRHLTFVIVDE